MSASARDHDRARPRAIPERSLWAARLDALPEAKRSILEELDRLRSIALAEEHSAPSWDRVLYSRGKVDFIEEFMREVRGS